jgi:hypothetical protein
MNKNIIFIVTILALATAAYLLFTSDTDSEAPLMTNETKTIVENDDYVGMTITEAEVRAQTEGVPFRVVEINGEPLPVTKDLREGRVNARVENGVITSYTIESVNPPQEGTETKETNLHDEIIGMTTAEAEAYAEAKAVDFRVGTIDGEPMPVTLDYRPGRITAEIANGIVVGYNVE